MNLQDFLIALPNHAASLHLTHNEHKSYYLTVAQSIADYDHGYRDWISDEQRDLAIKHNECWTLQWYSHTPVGSYIESAYSLEALLKYVVDNAKEYD